MTHRCMASWHGTPSEPVKFFQMRLGPGAPYFHAALCEPCHDAMVAHYMTEGTWTVEISEDEFMVREVMRS